MKRRGKKRGPKNLLEVDPTLQKRICDILADANTIRTACDACGISERVYFDWCQKFPAFYAATRKARAQAKIKLIGILSNAAKTNPNHAQWLLERSWPDEYARTERIEQVNEPAGNKKSLTILYNTKNQTLEELLTFPIHPNMADSAKVARAKQLGQTTAKAPAQPEQETISDEDSDISEEKISDAPPPSVVHPALGGRIRPEWKGNGK